MTRGYKNNNPCNIRINADKFKGEVVPSRDGAFKQFESMAYGYRAVFRTLYTYQSKYGCTRLAEFINRWAPPSENNTRAYIATIAQRTGIADVETIDVTNETKMLPIVAAMSYVENGEPAVIEDVVAGWELFIKEIKG